MCLSRVRYGQKRIFARCFIVMGYYTAYQDLPLSNASQKTMISNIYYPIFQDAHNWESPSHRNLWDGIGDMHARHAFDLKGRTWTQVPRAECMAMRQARADDHNRIFQHKKRALRRISIYSETLSAICTTMRYSS